MTSQIIKQKFIRFFEGRGHKELPAASLVPKDDTSVLFTTAGMQQFKRFYLKPKDAPVSRIVTIQPCLRTTDIDEVGDATHLTFFEMLGNFSFGYPEKGGSYFKKEAILWALEFLTKKLGVSKDRISATYFKGNKEISEDKESLKILRSISGLKKIKAHGADNFWTLGTDGSPAGPTVEFYIDGAEIWNLVFNEYIFSNGKYELSKYHGVDTGMGLERLAMVLQNKKTVFETDLFDNLKSQISNLKITFQNIKLENRTKDLRIILDHLRAAEALASEGLAPSNKEQEYILRRLIRRAVIHSQRINFDFMNGNNSDPPTPLLLGIYQVKDEKAEQIISKEIKIFLETIRRGRGEFEKIAQKAGDKISGRDVFYLFESFGFPLELTQQLAKERQKTIDEKEFQTAVKEHRKKSRSSRQRFSGGLASGGAIETRYHTANHLLLAALRKILGGHIQQKGSNITSERLRFDFSHSAKMTKEEIKKVEALVNEKIQAGLLVKMEEMALEKAKASGATGVFDDRYASIISAQAAEKVKVYTILDEDGKPFSREICGGPHVKNTREIGKFQIIKEESSSAGVRRIRAKITRRTNL